jgi:hypothetical protein
MTRNACHLAWVNKSVHEHRGQWALFRFWITSLYQAIELACPPSLSLSRLKPYIARKTATGAHTDQWTEYGGTGIHFKGPYIVSQIHAIMKHNSIPGLIMRDFVMDKSGTGAGFLRELRFPLSIYIPSASPQSSSITPEAGTIGQEWPQYQ